MPPRTKKPKPTGSAALGPRGSVLWAALHKGSTLSPEAEELALEACRTADRLDRLEAILSGVGNEWVSFTERRDGDVIVVVDSALSEARQQALALRALLAEVRKAAPAAEPEQEEDVVDALKARRERRHGTA